MPSLHTRLALQRPAEPVPAAVLVVEQQAWPMAPHAWQVRFKIFDSNYAQLLDELRNTMGANDFEAAWADGPDCRRTRRSRTRNAVGANANGRVRGGRH